MVFDVQLSDRLQLAMDGIEGLRLPMLGLHNVQNCLAAIAVALEMGVGADAIRSGLAGFAGVGRRFDIKGQSGGVTIVDDYGHHPVEIKAALSAGRLACGNHQLIAVVQPHRYSRLRDLFADFCGCFNEADAVLVADVYAAGEQPIEGASKEALVAGLRDHGHRAPAVLDSPSDLASQIAAIARPGDYVMVLGAGSSSQWAAALPAELDQLTEAGR